MKKLIFVLSFLCLGSLLFLGSLIFFSEWINANNFTYEKLLAYQPSQLYLEKHADEIAQMTNFTNTNYGYILAATYSFLISLGVCVFGLFVWFIVKTIKTLKTNKKLLKLILCLTFPQEFIAFHFLKNEDKE